MSLTNILTKNEKVFNGLQCASISALIGVPAGIYLTNKILKKFNLQSCIETKKALNDQMNTIVSIAVICGYIYGYTSIKKVD